MQTGTPATGARGEVVRHGGRCVRGRDALRLVAPGLSRRVAEN